jgi:hypothetical protein
MIAQTHLRSDRLQAAISLITCRRNSGFAAMSNLLFSDDEESDGGRDVQLNINDHYAKAFEYRKEREELERRT